jgi:phosphotriesterase-related protein
VSTVQTIRGPIDSSELGRTLSHEHLSTAYPGIERLPGFIDSEARRAEMVDRCVDALARAADAGIDSIIDLTPFDLGRQMWLFEAVAARSSVNVVCATGVYRWVPPIYWGLSEDELAALWITEIEDGIEGTGIRPGFIKLAWDLEYELHPEGARLSPRMLLERTARAAARAARATGTPISCHTLAARQLGTPLLDIFEEEGLDLRAVTIGHSNDTDDMAYLGGLAARGATVGLDRFSNTARDYVAERSSIALALIEAGYAEQVTFGHDAQPAGFWGRWSEEPRPDLWTLVSEHELPWLREHGATNDQIDAVLRRSMQATVEAAAAMAR